MAIFGYLRVSTDLQTVENQRNKIEQAGFAVTEWFEDSATSGTISAFERTGFKALLAKAVAGDTIITVEVSRIGRTTTDVLNIVEHLRNNNIQLRIMNMAGMDFTSSSGRFMLSTIASFGQFEREILVERVHAGIARTRAQGTICGRRQTNSPDKIKAILADLQAGIKRMDVAHRHQVSEKTVSTYKKQYSCAEAFKQLEAKWEQLQKQISAKTV
jgi:DNA invertase Pin-like site-specific DNA recombinase